MITIKKNKHSDKFPSVYVSLFLDCVWKCIRGRLQIHSLLSVCGVEVEACRGHGTGVMFLRHLSALCGLYCGNPGSKDRKTGFPLL